MVAVLERRREPVLQEIIERYPEVSAFVIIKIDVQRRGVRYTDRALAQADPNKHLMQARNMFASVGENNDLFPVSLLLRDGTTIISAMSPDRSEAYVVDFIDGRLVITDDGAIVEEVEYWPKPDFHDQLTASGKPMWQIVGITRPQRLDFNPYSHCHFWDDGQMCQYCNIGSIYQQEKRKNNKPLRVATQDISDTVAEALKQPGRYTNIMLSGGSIPGADNSFAEEVDLYVEILQAIGEHFTTPRFPSQLISSAFDEQQLERIHSTTGLLTYTTDLEVLNEDKFNWISPGKAARVGYQTWRQRLINAVDIFGRGNVNTGFVGGVETARPHGYVTEAEGLAVTLEGVEELASHGVGAVFTVWNPVKGSVFQKQTAPSLDYFVRLTKGVDDISQRYGLVGDMDDYRRCGNHPNTDLGRLW